MFERCVQWGEVRVGGTWTEAEIVAWDGRGRRGTWGTCYYFRQYKGYRLKAYQVFPLADIRVMHDQPELPSKHDPGDLGCSGSDRSAVRHRRDHGPDPLDSEPDLASDQDW